MAVLVDISPTSVEFVHNGVIYQISEIMKNGHELIITAKEKRSEDEIDSLVIEPK